MGDEIEDDEGGRSSGDGLAEELRALGRGLRIPDVDGESMAERVLAQLLTEAVPVPVPDPPGWRVRTRKWLRMRWRVLAAGLSGLLVVLVLTPPVRAAVTDWFGLGGVEVRYDPSPGASGPHPAPGTPARVPECVRPVTLAEAARRAGFTPRVPAALGAPEAVSVTEAVRGRFVISLCWTEEGRTVRLDEFGASLDIGFVKQVRVMPQWMPLTGQGDGLWFDRPHQLRFPLVSADGDGWTESVRMAGPTLLWEPGGDAPVAAGDERLTLRLEGVSAPDRAKTVAESVAR